MPDFAAATTPWLMIFVVLAGYVVFGLTGFGSALVIIPLLSWHEPLSTTVPLVLVLDLLASLVHTGLNLRQVHWPIVPLIAPQAAAGAIAGAYLHRWSHSNLVFGLLGLYIVGVAVQGFQIKKPSPKPRRLATVGAGVAMGAVETLFGTAGPIVMAWLTRKIPDVEVVRATAPVMIMMMVIVALTSNALAGHVDGTVVLSRLLFLLPVAAAGAWWGHRLSMAMTAGRLEKFIFAGLFISGSSMVLRAFF